MRSGKSILLEPWFSFRLEVPTENLGRAMSDITRMNGSFEAPETEGNNSVLTGSVPVASMGDYGKEVASYTKGHGRLSCTLKGYEPCHNPEEVMAEIGYDPEADVVNPTGSVFCAHGAGFQVSWDQVPEYAHVESGWKPEKEGTKDADGISDAGLQAVNRQQGAIRQTGGGVERIISQEEIEEIFRQTYGKRRRIPTDSADTILLPETVAAIRAAWREVPVTPVCGRSYRRKNRRNTFWWTVITLFCLARTAGAGEDQSGQCQGQTDGYSV